MGKKVKIFFMLQNMENVKEDPFSFSTQHWNSIGETFFDMLKVSVMKAKVTHFCAILNCRGYHPTKEDLQ